MGLIRQVQESRRWAISLLLVLVPTAVFYVNYRVADKEVMFLVAHLLTGLSLAPGYVVVSRRLDSLKTKVFS